jgi:hypothetical protein
MYSLLSTGIEGGPGVPIQKSCVTTEPAGVVTVIEGLPTGADAETMNVAVRDVPPAFGVTLLKVRPDQAVERTEPARLAPVTVTKALEPWGALDGTRLVMDGAAEPLPPTVKLKFVLPPIAWSVTTALPAGAVGAMLNVANT